MDETPQKKVHIVYVVLIIVLLLAGAGGFFYWLGIQWYGEIDSIRPPVATNFVNVKKAFQIADAAGIGAEIFEKTANPVQGELPDVAPPVVNPLDELYHNPFE